MLRPHASALGCALAVLAAAAPAAAQPVPAELIALQGQPPPGETDPIATLNSPFTDGLGRVGFTGSVTPAAGGSGNFVWHDAGVVWFNADALPGNVLTGAEGTMGTGDAGQFIYSPAVDGDDAVWTHNGVLLVDGTQAPGFPPGTNNTFNSRPQMRPGGQAYWVSGFNETGGTATQGRMLYTSPDAMPGTITVVLRSDDLVGGFPIDRPSGIGFDYQFSDDGAHHIQDLILDTGSTANDSVIYVDGAVVAQEGSPAGGGLPGENWSSFDVVSINDAGDHIVSGDTSGPTATDEFIAFNAVIALREGGTVGGVTLTSTAAVQAAAINDLSQAVHLWSVSGGVEHLFFAPDAADLATGVRLLSTGDQVDVDGDMVADFTVDDFNASTAIGPGLDLAEDGFVYVEVDLAPAAPPLGGVFEAILRLGLPIPNVAATPSPFDFGPVTVGATVLQAFTVENTGSADLDVSGTQITGPDAGDFAIVSGGGPFVLGPGAQQVVEIEFTPSTVGPKNADFEIASDDPDTPVLVVPLTGAGVAAGAPDIAVDPPSFDYGPVPVGATVPQAFTVENLGSVDLNVASTAITGADAADFAIAAGGGAFTLAPGAQQVLEVEFTPGSIGPKSAALEVASDDPDTPLLTVPLTGEGIAAGGGPSVLEIPAVSPLGLAALAALLLGLGLGVLRRRPA
jgi:hypothetical protein